nr:nucleotide-binding, alpha-beta plait [Tanacetum cinerariifolium]
MEEQKKRKVEDLNGEIVVSNEQLRSLLEPLPKNQLVDLLSKLGCQYPSIAKEIKSVASADPANRKLFVRGLSWNTTSETLCAAFKEHGEIEEGAVIIDKASGKSRGYGFITYKDIEATRKALEAPSKLIDGRMAVCILACEGVPTVGANPDQAQRKLYIGGLSPEITNESLLTFFGTYGEIEEGSVAYDKETNKSRGFGFITYKTVEAAKKAIDTPQKMFGGRNITVKLADNQKNKGMQTQQAPGGMVPIQIAGYAQPGKTHPSVGYTYAAQPIASYPGAIAYPTHPLVAPVIPPPYPVPPQITYPQYTTKKENYGPSQPPSTGLGAYAYYLAKQ